MKKLHNLSISKSILLFITFMVAFVLLIGGIITYNIFFGTTNDVVETTSREINKQIIMNYENYIFDVIDVADYVTEASLNYTKENDIATLQNIYQTMDQVNSNISTITLLDSTGSTVVSSETNKTIHSTLQQREWFLVATSEQTIYHFSTPHQEDIYVGGNHDVITVSKVITFEQSNVEEQGVLVFELEVNNFQDLSEKTNLGEHGHIVLIDEQYQTVLTNNTDCLDSDCVSIDVMRDIILGGEFVDINDTNMHVNVNTVSLTRWRIGTFINSEQVIIAKNSVIVSLLVAFVLAFIGTFFISSMFSRRITSPIYELNEYMNKFQKGSMNQPISIDGQKELVELGESFNQMIEEIATLMNEVLVEQTAKRKTQFIALQNQINPHFLYNTLDSILWLNEQQRTDEVGQMIVALSKFFRTSISTEQNRIPLEEEMEHIKSYLLIQTIRYHNRFTYRFEIDETLLSFEVLKLGLQPIVENAIYHGINPEQTDNYITIRAHQNEEFVYLEVENSGYGMNPDDISQILGSLYDAKSSTHIGLKNIAQRLRLYYGDKATIEIESVLDEHTVVRLCFPTQGGERL